MNTLRRKLIMSYLIITITIVLLLSIAFNLALDKLFKKYAIIKQNHQIKQILSQIEGLYNDQDKSFDIKGLEIIGNAALQNGYVININSFDKKIDWDSKNHKNEQCEIIISNANKNMQSIHPFFRGGYIEAKHELRNSAGLFAEVGIGYYGPYSFNDNEIILINKLNIIFVAISILLLLPAVIFGNIVSRRITTPISSVVKVAEKIVSGKYGAKTEVNSRTEEIQNLIKSINALSMELEEKDLQKQQITSDIAHELRTPLTNLQGYLEAIIDGVWEADSVRIQECYAEVIRLNKIVDELQELNLLEDSRYILHKEEFDFRELVESVIRSFDALSQEKNIKIKKIIKSNLKILADYNRLKQVLINLISNAIKYSYDNGTIIVKYSVKKEYYIIDISDNGIGIPDEDLPFIFERFYRTDKSRSKKTGGTGIGLAITKAIVENHNGTISVRSSVRLGTSFKIKLPRE